VFVKLYPPPPFDQNKSRYSSDRHDDAFTSKLTQKNGWLLKGFDETNAIADRVQSQIETVHWIVSQSIGSTLNHDQVRHV
jgi:hypothetical protein